MAFRPVTTACLAVNYAISGYNVWSYHAINIMLHLVNAVLVFLMPH